MASLLQASTTLFSSSSSSSSSFSSSRCSSKRAINAAISVPKPPRELRFSVPKIPTRDLNMGDNGLPFTIPLENSLMSTSTIHEQSNSSDSTATTQLYALLEAVRDRVEMHKNIGEQRNNWNTLLLNSINMITLTAATIAGVAAIGGAGVPLLALKLSSTLLFSAATGMLVIMNKLQPSQLVEEQRNATRLFKQLQNQIQTKMALRDLSQEDVKDVMEKVLALDKAYPLPLLGAMLEKFPKSFEPAVWWPTGHFNKENKKQKQTYRSKKVEKINGWSEELEGEMREIVEVLKTKDEEEYNRLGNIVLKVNKILAISGPLLTGIAASMTPFIGHGSWTAIVAVLAGAIASTVNTLEHGGQVGMVFEMYRNSAGFFTLLQESIESTLNEGEVLKRENGEMFEMKVALQLGRSLSQLRDLAKKSSYFRIEGTHIDEFASKLF